MCNGDSAGAVLVQRKCRQTSVCTAFSNTNNRVQLLSRLIDIFSFRLAGSLCRGHDQPRPSVR